MEFIIRGCKMGKTTELIERASRDSLYIVCRCRTEAQRIHKRALEMGKQIPFPITFDEFIQGRYRSLNINGFLIDDADLLLRKMAGIVPVNAVTATGAVEVLPNMEEDK